MKHVLILVFAIVCMPFLGSNAIAEEQANEKTTIEIEQQQGKDKKTTKPVDKKKDNTQEEEEEPDCED